MAWRLLYLYERMEYPKMGSNESKRLYRWIALTFIAMAPLSIAELWNGRGTNRSFGTQDCAECRPTQAIPFPSSLTGLAYNSSLTATLNSFTHGNNLGAISPTSAKSTMSPVPTFNQLYSQAQVQSQMMQNMNVNPAYSQAPLVAQPQFVNPGGPIDLSYVRGLIASAPIGCNLLQSYAPAYPMYPFQQYY